MARQLSQFCDKLTLNFGLDITHKFRIIHRQYHREEEEEEAG